MREGKIFLLNYFLFNLFFFLQKSGGGGGWGVSYLNGEGSKMVEVSRRN